MGPIGCLFGLVAQIIHLVVFVIVLPIALICSLLAVGTRRSEKMDGMRMAVLLITLVGAMDLRAYPYSQSDRKRIEEADRRGGDEGRWVRAKIQQEHLDRWVFLNKMRKKNAVFYVTENGTLDVMRDRPRAHPQDPYAGMTALERDAAKRRAESAARSRDYQRRMAEEAARVSYAISAQGKLDRSVARLREMHEKMERDKVRRAQREIKRLKKLSRQLGIELDLKE